jgi:AcrR family transcriptional regulator
MPRKKTLPDAAVLNAAGRVFGRLGPSRFTLADVAREAGIAPATVAQRFGSKRALLLAFAAHAASAARKPFEEARAQSSRPLSALRTALALASSAVGDRLALRNALAFLLEDLSDETLRAHAARHARWTEASIRDLLDDAVRQGELDQHDTRRLAHALHASWNGALVQWALRGRGPLGPWLAAVVDTLLDPHRPDRLPAQLSRMREPRAAVTASAQAAR